MEIEGRGRLAIGLSEIMVARSCSHSGNIQRMDTLIDPIKTPSKLHVFVCMYVGVCM